MGPSPKEKTLGEKRDLSTNTKTLGREKCGAQQRCIEVS